MAMRRFFSEIKGMKVKDVPAHVKPMVTTSNAKNFIQRALDNYHAKYIQTDSIVPLYHVCFGGMIFSYLVALPEERRHLEHQQHAKEHGGHWFPHRIQVISISLLDFSCTPVAYDVDMCFKSFDVRGIND